MRTLIHLFKKPTAFTIAQQTYEQVQRDLLEQESAAEYHAKMVEYHKQTLRRLSSYLNDQGISKVGKLG